MLSDCVVAPGVFATYLLLPCTDVGPHGDAPAPPEGLLCARLGQISRSCTSPMVSVAPISTPAAVLHPPTRARTHARCMQVLYKIYEAAELQPFLDAANAEKEAGASS